MASAPTVLNTSCNLFITGINASMFCETNIHSFDSQYSNDELNLTICPFLHAFCFQNEIWRQKAAHFITHTDKQVQTPENRTDLATDQS
jgi:hypothetical protein